MNSEKDLTNSPDKALCPARKNGREHVQSASSRDGSLTSAQSIVAGDNLRTKEAKESEHPRPMSSATCTQASYPNVRRWQRCKLSVPIRVILSGAHKTRIIDGRGNELSEGGMALTVGLELSVGDQVAVEFTPPYSGPPIRAVGTIRNRQGYRYGIEFRREAGAEAEQVDRLRLMLSVMAQPTH